MSFLKGRLKKIRRPGYIGSSPNVKKRHDAAFFLKLVERAEEGKQMSPGAMPFPGRRQWICEND